MSAAAAAVSATVHIEIDAFQALSEQGHWDACAVVAEIDALHVCGWNAVALAENSINAWRWQYVQAGRWTQGSGTTLGNIYWHLTKTPIHAHIAAYLPFSETPNLTALHSLVKQQSLLKNPIIVQVVNAQALPHAEQGVHSHFVTIGGIDSQLGYLVANGDTIDAIQHAAGAIVPCYWATWQTLVNAQIRGAIALDASYKPATPPAPPDTSIDMAQALALAQELVKALGG